MKGFKKMMGQEEEDPMDELNEMCTLSRTQRLIGFGITFAIGTIVTFLAILAIPDISENPSKFALLYTVGNILSLCSTMFLSGPCTQVKKMFEKTRAIATIVYLLSIVLTFVVAFEVKSVPLVLLTILIQFLAMCWYCLSYIPYGRKMLLKLCRCE